MPALSTKAHVLSRLRTTPANTGVAEALVQSFRSLISSDSHAVTAVVNAARSSDWSAAKAEMAELVRSPAYKSLGQTAADEAFKSMALVAAVDGGLILGAQGLAGVLTGTTDFSAFYSCESLGLSLGATEGLVAMVGVYVSTDAPADAGGTDFFVEVSGDFGVGAAVEGSHSLSGGSGLTIMLSTGEEIEISAGVGDSWVRKI